jgi:hypothetical protein
MVVALMPVVLVAAGCDGGGTQAPRPSVASETPQGGSEDQAIDRSMAIYSAVIRRLVTKDHTFGQGESPFGHVYVVDGVVPKAGRVNQSFTAEPEEPFSDDLKRGIREELLDLPPIVFVPDRESALGGAGSVLNDGVIITLGPIQPSGNRVKVENNLWCGGLCGQWLTYVVERQDDRWRITGTVGPYAIS